MNKKVAIVYTHYPHYRGAIFEALLCSDEFNYHLYVGDRRVDPTIRDSDNNDYTLVKNISIGPFVVQTGFFFKLLRDGYDGVIFLGNPYILSTWFYLVVLKLFRVRTALWTHGWLRNEGGIKGAIRLCFYSLSNYLFLYGNYARRIGIQHKFKSESLHVIYNSIDDRSILEVRKASLPNISETARDVKAIDYFLAVGRLVPELKLDLAVRAIALMDESVTLVVVGDGPEKERLFELAKELNVSIKFLGAIYDEDTLSDIFLNCIAVVSPGKVGLLALHSLLYYRPVITHGDIDFQMPEFEALQLVDNKYFFELNNVSSLVEVLKCALDDFHKGMGLDTSLIEDVFKHYYGVEAQKVRINDAVRKMLKDD